MGEKDAVSLAKRIYEATPYELRQVGKWMYGAVPLRIRYGRDFFRVSSWLERSQWWPPEKMAEYQNERLRALIRHAYENVPYYRRVFKERGIRPSDIDTMDDLAKIPVLTKETLRTEGGDLLAANVDKRDLVCLSTSGTTGRPVHFYCDKRLEYADGDPFWWRRYQWAGCGLTIRRAALTAWTLPPKRGGRRRVYAYNPARRLLTLSTYDLSRKNVDTYAFALRKYRPKIINGFPSALELLVKYFTEAGMERPVMPVGIFTQSERLQPWQRDAIGDFFGCPIFDWYGMEERVVCASECEEHRGHHIFSEQSIVEFVKEGKWVKGQDAEIIATRLNHYGMPLIRYQTGDIGRLLEEQCSCGRGLPLMKLIGGRERNFALTKEGGWIPVTIVDIPKATKHVDQFQFVQREKGALTLKLVRGEGFSEDDTRLVRENLRDKFGDMFQVEIEFVGNIPRTPRGKIPLLVQHLRVEGE